MDIRMEEVRDIPSGLLTCLVDGEEVSIEQISPKALWIRTAEPLLFVEKKLGIELMVYHPETDQYQKTGIPCYHVESMESKKYYYIYKIIVSHNPAYEHAVHDITMQYYHYIQNRYESADYVFPVGKLVKSYDTELDEQFAENFENNEQASLRECILNLVKKSNGSISLACCLQNHQAYKRFLERTETSENEPKNNLQEMHTKMSSTIIFEVSSRLYIGNQFCHHLLPDSDMMIQMIEKATQEEKAVTIVLSYLRDEKLEEMQQWINTIYEYVKHKRMALPLSSEKEKKNPLWRNQIEIEINDWGYLPMLVDKQDVFTPVLGTLLNRRRKDPRIQYIEEFQKVERYGENQLNDAVFQKYLKEYGITRYEYEACGYPLKIAPGQHSLHLPLYQTNTSQHCPLRALVLYGDRGHQVPVDHCSHLCEQYAIAYPEHLHMAGLYNSIFGYDNALLETDRIEKYIYQEIDRIVWNLEE